MKTYNLSAQPRTEIGKKASKLLRNAGLIPVGLIGGERVDLPYAGALKEGERVVDLGNNKGIIVTSLAVKAEDVRKLIYTPEIFAIDLDVNGAKKTAILKEIQFHPVKDEILYIDLLEVNDKKPVVIEVPVKLEGHAEGVKAGGKLSLSMKKLKVKAVYTNIPGKTMQVGDLSFEGLELTNAKNAVVCAVQLTRAARGAAQAAAAAK